jgi:hypothetical protein
MYVEKLEVLMKLASLVVLGGASLLTVAAGYLLPVESQAATPTAQATLDYDFFKANVEAVFLTKRPGHSRCVACHTENNAPFHLVPLSPGATSWNEEQSRQNFQLIQRVAIPGSMDSPLVHHPLAQEAGGDPHHGGGQQFGSQQDPAWLTLKAFVMGQKVN